MAPIVFSDTKLEFCSHVNVTDKQHSSWIIHGPKSGGKKLQQSNLKLGGVLQFFSHIYDYCHRLNSERIRNTKNVSV